MPSDLPESDPELSHNRQCHYRGRLPDAVDEAVLQPLGELPAAIDLGAAGGFRGTVT